MIKLQLEEKINEHLIILCTFGVKFIHKFMLVLYMYVILIWILYQHMNKTIKGPKSYYFGTLCFTNFNLKRFLIFQAPVHEKIPQRAVAVGLALDL